MPKSTRKSFKLTVTVLICVVITLFALCSLSACDKDENVYLKDNNFEVAVSDGETARVHIPVGFDAEYGIILYVGLFVEPKYYDYLANALARQGYVVVIPKFEINSAYSNYKAVEPAYKEFPNVKFFLAGQDNGGGAAVRRAEENPSKTQGVILINPICFSQQQYDENGKLVYDKDGNVVKHADSIASLSLPTLLLESETDELRPTPEMKSDALSRLNEKTLTKYLLENSTNLGFNQNGEDSEARAAQREKTVELILKFLKNAIK